MYLSPALKRFKEISLSVTIKSLYLVFKSEGLDTFVDMTQRNDEISTVP